MKKCWLMMLLLLLLPLGCNREPADTGDDGLGDYDSNTSVQVQPLTDARPAQIS